VDVQVGRIVDEIDKLGYGDNTLIFYIWGDNGSSSEGQGGTISELLAQNGIPTTVKQHITALEELGGLDVLGSHLTDNMYHAGWAWAGSTPYKGTKLLASHFGGTRNPMAVRWPAKIKPDAVPRTQFHHVNDVVPTIYEILGISPPRTVNGVEQDPIDGVSFAYTLGDPKAKGQLLTQYFEIMGSRAIYHDGCFVEDGILCSSTIFLLFSGRRFAPKKNCRSARSRSRSKQAMSSPGPAGRSRWQ
jgi:arylsulfatase